MCTLSISTYLRTLRLATLRSLVASSFLLLSLLPAWAESRLVVAGGMITEVIYKLGLEATVVGVDTTSLSPARALKEKANVGYLRALSAEGILALNPTKLLATAHAGPAVVLDSIRSAGVSIMQVPEPANENDIISNILAIASELGAAKEGELLATDVRRGFSDLARQRELISSRKRVLFVLSTQNGRMTVAGRNSSADFIIRLAGAENAVAEFDGYKLITNEAIVNSEPDVVLAISRGVQFENARSILSHPAIALTPAGINGHAVVMDGLYLLGLGIQTPRAAMDLLSRIYLDNRGLGDAK